ncbi:MAG: WG repeat-containing protein [Treponema sp.]|nr:WG repeat-containing protein [Treponema sp.]
MKRIIICLMLTVFFVSCKGTKDSLDSINVNKNDSNTESSSAIAKNNEEIELQTVQNENKKTKQLKDDETLIPFEINGKIGFINGKKKIIFPPIYDELLQYSSHIMYVRKRANDGGPSARFILLPNGNVIEIGLRDDSGLIGDKYYYITKSFKKEIKSELYDFKGNKDLDLNNLQLREGVCETLFITENPYDENNSRYDYSNQFGDMLMPHNTFKRIKSFSKDGTIAVIQDEDFVTRIIDSSGNYIVDKTWWELTFYSDGLTYGGREGEHGYFDKQGNLVIPVISRRELPRSFHSERLSCIIEDGNIIIPETDRFSSNWAIIDTKANIIKSNITALDIGEYSDDGTAVLFDYDGDRTLKRKLIDRNGEFIVNEWFDKIQSSINGYSRAILNGKDYLISSYDGSLIKCEDLK